MASYPDITVVVGSGRSGTAFSCVMLGAAFDIGFSGEPKFVEPFAKRVGRYGDLRDRANLLRLATDIHEQSAVFQHLRDTKHIASTPQEIVDRVVDPTYTGVLYAVFRLVAEKRGHGRLGYKDPRDVVHLPLVAELLPTARFLHVVRDGRDVALSLLQQQWGQKTLYSGMRYWRRTVEKGHRDGLALGDRYLEVRFEDLVGRPELVAKPVARFLALPGDDEAEARLIRVIQKRADRGKVSPWKQKLDARQRELCEAVAGPTLRRYGYETEFESPRLPMLRAGYYVLSDLAQRSYYAARRRVG